MQINQFSPEILEVIFIYVPYDNKIELVCKLWNEICSKEIIKNQRIPCLCLQNPYMAILCKALIHECVCHISPHYAGACRYGGEHPCICIGSPHDAIMCKGEEHLCICEEGQHSALRCREEKDRHICVCDLYSHLCLDCV